MRWMMSRDCSHRSHVAAVDLHKHVTCRNDACFVRAAAPAIRESRVTCKAAALPSPPITQPAARCLPYEMVDGNSGPGQLLEVHSYARVSHVMHAALVL